MARIRCEIYELMLTGRDGKEVPGVKACCTCCDGTTESYGRSDKSVRRCLFLMKESCENYEDGNFYVPGGGDYDYIGNGVDEEDGDDD